VQPPEWVDGQMSTGQLTLANYQI